MVAKNQPLVKAISCRWDDGGYDYLAIVGSKGRDNIVVKEGNITQPAVVWGSVELRLQMML